jgi:alkaline phosphatase D
MLANRNRVPDVTMQARVSSRGIKLDFDDESSPIVATEFVGSSISSYGPPYEPIARVLPDNPHVHFFDSRRRGYGLVDLSADAMAVQMRVVSDAHDADATIATLRSFAVEGGRAGVVEA